MPVLTSVAERQILIFIPNHRKCDNGYTNNSCNNYARRYVTTSFQLVRLLSETVESSFKRHHKTKSDGYHDCERRIFVLALLTKTIRCGIFRVYNKQK